MSYEKQLLQMKKLIKKPASKKKEQQLHRPPAPAYEKDWLNAGLEKEENAYGVCYKKVIRYPKEYQHGNVKLSGLRNAIELWDQSKESHPLAAHQEDRLLFFDTETTGLKGAGTLIFLMGLLEEQEDAFALTQYVLPGPDHEAAFLYASHLWEAPKTIVTYNGKSFDMPQLETRWTMNRQLLPPFIEHHQIDLLHGARRIWKGEIERFSLTTIEAAHLQFVREDDIPGHLAPIIYQDAVRNGRADLLMKVLQHNEWDILSLVALYIKATELVVVPRRSTSAITGTNIGKWYQDLKSYQRSKDTLEQVLSIYGEDYPRAYYHLAFLQKKEGAIEHAIASFQIAATYLEGRERIISLEELAKLYEHRLKELSMAKEIVKQARHWIREDQTLSERFQERMEMAFAKREMRLFRKLFPGQPQITTRPKTGL